MASKRKVNLDDYQLTTTLGTGKLSNKKRRPDQLASKEFKPQHRFSRAIKQSTNFIYSYRILWPCIASKKQEDRRVLCHETFEEGGHHQAQTG